MLKNLVQLFHAEASKECKFLCDADTDLQIVKNALVKFLGYVSQVEEATKQAKDAAEAKAAAAAPAPVVEDPKPTA